MVDLNKKYCEEIKKLNEENEELKKTLQERKVRVGEIKEIVSEEVKNWKEEREQQQKMDMVVFGVKEKNLPMKIARERKKRQKGAKEIIAEVAEEGEDIVEQIEEVYRIGKYNENETRPMKIRFMSQTTAEHILIQRTGKLAEVEGMRGI